MVKEIEANLCFCIFGKNSNIQSGRHFWGEEIFLKIAEQFAQIPCGLTIPTKSLDRNKFVFLHFLQKCQNSKWPSFLRGGNFFLKITKSSLLRYPVGRKF